MNNSIDDQLKELRQIYKNKLPDKINEIISLWKRIEIQPTQDDITLFYGKVHGLHGTAATYGFTEIGKLAEELEAIISSFAHNPDLVDENKSNITALIIQLSNLSS